jgi:hypothetical protein
MLTLPKKRRMRAHWKNANRLLLEQAGAAAVTRQVQLALSRDGKFDVSAFEHLARARRWPGAHNLED